MNIKAASLTPEQALAELEARYEASVTALRKAIGDYIDHNTLPDTEARAEGLFVYPQLSVSWDGADHKALKTRLGTFHPCRLLYHHHYESETVPQLFAGTADPAVSGLWRAYQRRAVAA